MLEAAATWTNQPPASKPVAAVEARTNVRGSLDALIYEGASPGQSPVAQGGVEAECGGGSGDGGAGGRNRRRGRLQNKYMPPVGSS